LFPVPLSPYVEYRPRSPKLLSHLRNIACIASPSLNQRRTTAQHAAAFVCDPSTWVALRLIKYDVGLVVNEVEVYHFDSSKRLAHYSAVEELPRCIIEIQRRFSSITRRTHKISPKFSKYTYMSVMRLHPWERTSIFPCFTKLSANSDSLCWGHISHVHARSIAQNLAPLVYLLLD
jgi:hypothetical protein